jgi:hypothetical protein
MTRNHQGRSGVRGRHRPRQRHPHITRCCSITARRRHRHPRLYQDQPPVYTPVYAPVVDIIVPRATVCTVPKVLVLIVPRERSAFECLRENIRQTPAHIIHKLPKVPVAFCDQITIGHYSTYPIDVIMDWVAHGARITKDLCLYALHAARDPKLLRVLFRLKRIPISWITNYWNVVVMSLHGTSVAFENLINFAPEVLRGTYGRDSGSILQLIISGYNTSNNLLGKLVCVLDRIPELISDHKDVEELRDQLVMRPRSYQLLERVEASFVYPWFPDTRHSLFNNHLKTTISTFRTATWYFAHMTEYGHPYCAGRSLSWTILSYVMPHIGLGWMAPNWLPE